MKVFLLAFTILMSGCSLISPVTSNTMDMIEVAAKSAPNGVKGLYQLSIQAAGRKRANVYLNTEFDYRDQRNVTIVLTPDVVKQCVEKFGSDPTDYFVGKSLIVDGEAKRVKIYLITNGRQTNKYYFQTHINVTNLSQIKSMNKNS